MKIDGLNFSNIELEIIPSKVMNKYNEVINTPVTITDVSVAVFDDYYNSAYFINDIERIAQELVLS